MYNKYILKKLDTGNKEDVKELFLSVFTASPWFDDWSDEQQFDLYISDLMGQGNSLSYGLYENGGLIALSLGRVKHWYTGTEYCIDEFCVQKAAQGRGIGTYFLKEIEKSIRKDGIIQIYLQTDVDVPAIDFYMKNGFVHLDTTVSLAKEI